MSAKPASVAAEGMPVLALQGVEKRFGALTVLQPTTLSIAAGHTLALIGPSGCGKTTLLRTVLGLERADAGEITIGGEQLRASNVLRLRVRMGYVVQGGGLFPHLTAAQNVTLMARYLRKPRPWIDERVRELTELARLPADALARYPAQLSGGQQQRVALMRALMLDPELLLLDEPLAAIDPLVRAELQDDLAAVFAALRKAVLLVTHDLDEAAFFGHEVALMQSGRIVQRGAFEQLLSAPRDPFVTRFLRAQRRDRARGEGSGT